MRGVIESGWLGVMLVSACVIGPDDRYNPPGANPMVASAAPLRTSGNEASETGSGDDSETGSMAVDSTSTSGDSTSSGTTSEATSFEPDPATSDAYGTESGSSEAESGETTEDGPPPEIPPECDALTYEAAHFDDRAALERWELFGEQGGPSLQRGALAFPFNSGMQRHLPWVEGEPVMTRFSLREAPAASTTFFLKLTFEGQCYVSLVLAGGALVSEDRGLQGERVPFSLEAHRWLRLLAAPGGRIEWAASPDGASWSTFAEMPSCATAPTRGGVKIEFIHSAEGELDASTPPVMVEFVDLCSPL